MLHRPLNRPLISRAPFSRPLFFVSVLLPALGSLASCTGGQIGGEVDSDSGGEVGNSDRDVCIEDRVRELHEEEESAFGFSAAEVMEAVRGIHEAAVDFGLQEGGLPGVVVLPEAGETAITVTVNPVAGSQKLVERSPAPRNSGREPGTTADYESDPCRDQLRFEADVTVVLDNGALSETYRAIFVSDGLLTSTRIPVDPSNLSGSLSIDASALEGAEVKEIHLSLAFAQSSMRGELSGVVEQRWGDVASVGPLSMARFPLAGCEYGFVLRAESEAGAVLSEALLSHTTFRLTFADDEPTPMTVIPEVGKMCWEPGDAGSGGTVTAPLTLGVQTEDGRISGVFDLAVRLEQTEDGTPSYVNVFRDAYLGSGIPNEDFEEFTGITGITSSARELTFSFGYGIDLIGALPASGEITIMELITADCASSKAEPAEDGDGVGGASGCAGTDVIEREMGTFIEELPK